MRFTNCFLITVIETSTETPETKTTGATMKTTIVSTETPGVKTTDDTTTTKATTTSKGI